VFEGRVEAIYIAAAERDEVSAVQAVRAVPRKGLEGDRYFLRDGSYSGADRNKEITLVESEAIEAAAQLGLELGPGGTRRNVVTRDVPLNHLVGVRFEVGEVTLEGMKLCEPCAYLQRLTGQKGLIKALLHRGGLRAKILNEGTIGVGDPIRAA
jgi:MOSC domain-containing protein YiiM